MATKITAPVRAFGSGSLYREVARDWKGTGFLYLFALLLALGFVAGVKSATTVAALPGDPTFQKLVDQIPPIEIVDGVVRAEIEQPHVFDLPTEDVVFVIDTTGEVTEIPKGYAHGVLLGRDRLVLRQPRETRVFDLSRVEHFRLDAERVRGWIRPAAWLALLVIGLGLPIVAFAYRALVALGLSGIASVVARASSVALQWQDLLRLSCVAMTPSIVIGTVLRLTGVRLGLGWLSLPLWGAVNLGYLAFALYSNRPGAGRRREENWLERTE